MKFFIDIQSEKLPPFVRLFTEQFSSDRFVPMDQQRLPIISDKDRKGIILVHESTDSFLRMKLMMAKEWGLLSHPVVLLCASSKNIIDDKLMDLIDDILYLDEGVDFNREKIRIKYHHATSN